MIQTKLKSLMRRPNLLIFNADLERYGSPQRQFQSPYQSTGLNHYPESIDAAMEKLNHCKPPKPSQKHKKEWFRQGKLFKRGTSTILLTAVSRVVPLLWKARLLLKKLTPEKAQRGVVDQQKTA
jgi:hypothetical protein